MSNQQIIPHIGRYPCWVENLYFQHFTGATFFQYKPPLHPSSLSRWPDRIGEEGAEWLLTKTIDAGQAVVDRSYRGHALRKPWC